MIKGVLFSSSPVRGAIELGCITRQQHREIQIKARVHARVIRNKTLCQSIKGEKKKRQRGEENLLDYVLINIERQEETKSALQRSRENSVIDMLEYFYRPV